MDASKVRGAISPAIIAMDCELGAVLATDVGTALGQSDSRWPQLSALPEIRRLVEECRAVACEGHEEAHRKAATTSIPAIENYVRVGLTQGVIARREGIDADAFVDAWTARLSSALSWSGDTHDVIAPLLNFDSPVGEPSELPNGVRIRGIPAEEGWRLLGPRSILGLLIRDVSPFLHNYQPRWLLEQRQMVGAGQSPDLARAFNEFRSVLATLHTFKAGQVDIPGVGDLMQPYGTVSAGVPSPWVGLRWLWSPFKQPFTLDASERPNYLRFATLALPFMAQGREHPLGLACQRVSETRLRPLDRDRILDASTSLEVVLLAGRSDELRYQLALRGSLLLSTTSDERRRNFDCLYAGYGRRNKLIHSGTDRPDEVNASAYVEIARRVVSRAVELSPSFELKRICELLDQFALDRQGEESFDTFLGRSPAPNNAR